jgi:hypothetical protein
MNTTKTSGFTSLKDKITSQNIEIYGKPNVMIKSAANSKFEPSNTI